MNINMNIDIPIIIKIIIENSIHDYTLLVHNLKTQIQKVKTHE